MNTAETPFEFVTVSYLTRIGNQSGGTLAELLTGLEHCSDASIFHHTFQTLGSHHFLTEGFSNDFAQWVLSDTNRFATTFRSPRCAGICAVWSATIARPIRTLRASPRWSDSIFAKAWKSPSLSGGAPEHWTNFAAGSRISAIRVSIFILFLHG